MYVQEITLDVSPDLEMDLMIDEFNWLMSNYHKNGQIANGGHTQLVLGNRIACLPYTLERDSLDRKYNNIHVNKQLKRLEDLCGKKLDIKTLGTNNPGHNEVCSCTKPSGYMLTALFFSRDSAIMCSDCRLSVPLYRLPKTEDESYMSILNWQLSSMVIEGYEIINLKNEKVPELSNNYLTAIDELGMDVCARIEQSTGITTRLFQKLGKTKENRRNNKSHPGKEMTT